MRIAALILALLAPAASAADAPVATVEIRAQGKALSAEYRLPKAVTRLPLRREYSAELRQKIWSIRTPGVRLEGSALVGAQPFKRVELTATPPVERTEKDYPPLLVFSDGGVGVFTGLFDVGAEGDRTRYRFVPARNERVVLAGRAHDKAVEWTGEPTGEGTYAYFGASALVPSGAGLAVLDATLPEWVRAEVDTQFPRLIAYFEKQFGMPAPFVPFVLFAYDGTAGDVANSQGSVLPGVLVMKLDGTRWADADANRASLRWTLAHEAAHFWNLDNRDAQGAAWMHEGSADAFARRALADLGLVEAGEAAAANDRALNECLLEIGGDSIVTAEKDGRFGLAYSCGLVVARYTEAALRQREPGADLFTFWRALLANAGGEGYTQSLYVATLAQASGNARAAAYAGDLAARRFDGPGPLSAAFARVGAPLGPAGDDVARGLGRPIATRLLTTLMSRDCGGSYSLSQIRVGLRVHGGKACKALTREIDVVAAEKQPLLERPREAWAAARVRCAAGRPVTLADKGGESVAVPCAAPLPELPALLGFAPG